MMGVAQDRTRFETGIHVISVGIGIESSKGMDEKETGHPLLTVRFQYWTSSHQALHTPMNDYASPLPD